MHARKKFPLDASACDQMPKKQFAPKIDFESDSLQIFISHKFHILNTAEFDRSDSFKEYLFALNIKFRVSQLDEN